MSFKKFSTEKSSDDYVAQIIAAKKDLAVLTPEEKDARLRAILAEPKNPTPPEKRAF